VQNGAQEELKRLVGQGFLSEKDGERVRISEIKRFIDSELCRDMLDAVTVYRELRFNVRLPAEIFTEVEDQKLAYSGRNLLVQGVIDCIVEYPDGTLGLFDYKTDRLSKEELCEENLAEKKLRDKHSLQLSYYALAVEKMFGKSPSRIGVYSLPLGRVVDIDPIVKI
jgi:ATP-dependent helicase/nuclease subunit A